MSDMKAATSRQLGEQFTPWKYHEYSDDRVAIAETEHAFEEQKKRTGLSLEKRIVCKGEKCKDGYNFLVDDQVKIDSFTQDYRKPKVEFWQSKRNYMIGAALVSSAVAIGSMRLLLGKAISQRAGGCCVITAAIAATVLGIGRGIAAQKQMTLWARNLPEIIANKRKESFAVGLLEIYKRDEKKSGRQLYLFKDILSNAERSGLYWEYLKSLSEELESCETSKKRMQLLLKVATCSPLNSKIINYVELSSKERERLIPYCQEYSTFLETFTSLEMSMENRIREVKHKAQRDCAPIKDSRAAAIQAVRCAYSLYKQNVKAELKSMLEKCPAGLQHEEAHKKMRAECRAKIEKAQRIRNDSIYLITIPFNMQIRSITAERDSCIDKIQRDRNAFLLPAYTQIATLHTRAHFAKINGRACSDEPFFGTFTFTPQLPAMPKAPPIPSAPSLQEILKCEQNTYDRQVLQDMDRLYPRLSECREG